MLGSQDWNAPSQSDKASLDLFRSLVQLSDPVSYSQIQAQLAPPKVTAPSMVSAPPMPCGPPAGKKLSKLEIVQTKQQLEQQLGKIIQGIKTKGLSEAEGGLGECVSRIRQIMSSLP